MTFRRSAQVEPERGAGRNEFESGARPTPDFGAHGIRADEQVEDVSRACRATESERVEAAAVNRGVRRGLALTLFPTRSLPPATGRSDPTC
jgi:hypothetical protein